MKGYHIGKRHVDQAQFDAEVKRLWTLGIKVNEIAERLKLSRYTISRSISRSKPSQEEKVEREYKELAQAQDFFELEEIKKWVEDLKARRVKKWRAYVYAIKSVCDEVQVYPSMLDAEYVKKWLSGKTQVPLEKLREIKVPLRIWLKFSKVASDSELLSMGLDAKHYAIGKWAMISLTESQIKGIEQFLFLENKYLFAFMFGVDTCSSEDEIRNIRPEHFYMEGNLCKCRIFRPKLTRSGKPYWTGWLRGDTYDLRHYATFGNGDIKRLKELLREAYHSVGAVEEYFYHKPIHAMRHIGAIRYLRRFNWNRTLVARLGHWKAEKTLEDHYGAMGDEYVDQAMRK